MTSDPNQNPDSASSAYEPPVVGNTPQHQGDSTGGLIPYKNPSALTSYYLSVFSLIPCIGLFLGIPAIILGIKGLKFHKQHPESAGVAHAWVGIILGSLTSLVWIAGIGFFAFGAIMASQGY